MRELDAALLVRFTWLAWQPCLCHDPTSKRDENKTMRFSEIWSENIFVSETVNSVAQIIPNFFLKRSERFQY